MKKVCIKRVGFSGIAALGVPVGRSDERIHVGINAAFMHQRNFGRTIQHKVGHYHPRFQLAAAKLLT